MTKSSRINVQIFLAFEWNRRFKIQNFEVLDTTIPECKNAMLHLLAPSKFNVRGSPDWLTKPLPNHQHFAGAKRDSSSLKVLKKVGTKLGREPACSGRNVIFDCCIPHVCPWPRKRTPFIEVTSTTSVRFRTPSPHIHGFLCWWGRWILKIEGYFFDVPGIKLGFIFEPFQSIKSQRWTANLWKSGEKIHRTKHIIDGWDTWR